MYRAVSFLQKQQTRICQASNMTAEGAEWIRSNFFHADMIGLFEKGIFHDCTFQVICNTTGDKKDFKCHKLVLATSSCVFEKMLFGHFLEARLTAEEAIPLKGVSPEVFECSMRFLYGQEKEFQNATFAMEIYKFAHEWQITSLLYAVNEFFKSICPTDALKVMHFCLEMENNEGLQICKEIVGGKNSSVALNSEAWLEMPEEVVQEVLEMDKLELPETEVLGALFKWGRAQVEKAGQDPSQDDSMRLIIDSCLKFIRWPHFDNEQFARLCQGEVGRVLSSEEKFKISGCIALKVWEHMPAQLGPICHELRMKTKQSFSLKLDMTECGCAPARPLDIFTSSFVISTSKNCRFEGLKFIPQGHNELIISKMNPIQLWLSEKDFPSFTLASCNVSSEKDTFQMSSDCILVANVFYSIKLVFPAIRQRHPYKQFNFWDSGLCRKSDSNWISSDQISVLVEGPVEGVEISELFFKMLD